MERIDLSGPEGNAFHIMGVVKKVCRKKNIDHKPFLEQMMSGDYDNLCDVVREHFADDIKLIS